MANYAYKDFARTKIIYADDLHIMNYKGIRCWCKNPKCNAHMYIVKPENPAESFFRASTAVKHTGACGSECHYFDKSEFDESKFKFPDILKNFEHVIPSKSDLSKKVSKRTLSSNKKPIKTIRQIYTMCTNTPINDSYGGIVIKDILADERTSFFYKNGIEGYKLVECNFYRYDDTTFTILMNFPCYSVYRVTEYYVQLEFMDEELYKKTRTRLYDTKHNSIIAISGDWKKVNFNTSPKPTKSRCIIYSARQIAVIQRG